MNRFDWDQVANKRERILFGVLLASLVFFFFGTAYPTKMNDLSRYQGSIDDLRLEKSAIEKFIHSTPVVSLSLSAGGGLADVKLQVLAGTQEAQAKDLASLLPRLSAPSFLQGVRLVGLSFQAPTPDGGFLRTDFILETSGQFREVVKFLERLEEFPALFQITNLVFSRGEEMAPDVRVEITCRFYERAAVAAAQS